MDFSEIQKAKIISIYLGMLPAHKFINCCHQPVLGHHPILVSFIVFIFVPTRLGRDIVEGTLEVPSSSSMTKTGKRIQKLYFA